MAQADILKALASTTPVKGSAPAAEAHGNADPSLDVLVARLEALERTQRLQAAQLEQAQGETGEYKGLYYDMVKDKKRAEEGLKAALEELQKLREAAPLNDSDRARLTASLMEEAQTKLFSKAERFKEVLRDAPRGEILNTTGETIPLAVNGVTVLVRPGKRSVPAPFVEAWENHLEACRYATEVQSLMEIQENKPLFFGDLEDLLWAGRDTNESVSLQGVRTGPLMWDEDAGVVG